MSPARRRFFQFFSYLWARVTPADTALAAELLPPPLAALFGRMAPGEQVHCLRVLRILKEAGQTQPDLLQAALLHDVGKSLAPINIFERVLAVLARRLCPRRYALWAQAEPRGWRKAFVTAVQHPGWGADLAARAGAPTRVVNLIRRHQAKDIVPVTEEDRLVVLLQNADRRA